MAVSVIGPPTTEESLSSFPALLVAALVTSPCTPGVPLARWRLLRAPSPHSLQEVRP